MRLIRKITLVLCAIFAVSMLLNYGALKWAVEPSFFELENRRAQENAERVYFALDAEMQSLRQLADDWAVWDDAYNLCRIVTPHL